MRGWLLVLVVGGCSSPSSTTSSPAPGPDLAPRPPSKYAGDDRNITAADYLGPVACGQECHAPQYEAWQTSLHRVMNARPGEAGAIVGRFDGAAVRYKGGELRMERDAAGYMMTARAGERQVRYRITRTIGHRGLQEYVGILDEPPAGSGAPAGREATGLEVRLPFGWWPAAGGWVPQPAFDPWLDEASFDPFAPVREPWAERCPWCHSTYPFVQRIARASGPRAVGHGLEQHVVLPASAGNETLDVAAQVTTGISCESCHLGGRAHAAGAPMQFLPRGAAPRDGAPTLPQTFAEQRKDARVVNTVCAQCHSGPSPRLADGTALRNSSEALDLARSPCRGITCTDCHDPHHADGQPDPAKVTSACTRCHEAHGTPAHAGQGHGTLGCVDCHMPRMVMGIDRYVRTHRISSPTNATLIAEAAPNACNLCHLDRSIGWTLTELRAGWEVKLAPSPVRYGDDEAAVGDVWLASESPAIRLVAAHAYAASPLGRYARASIAKGLTDPLAYVRAWTRLALEAIDGPIDRR